MENLFNLSAVAPAMATDDYVGFTFFVGCMAMMAASAFFFLSMNSFDNKWRTSILVSGLITFIAAVHYWYMRDYWATNATSPTFFRYVDWVLTVPLMCVEFYLILKGGWCHQIIDVETYFPSVVMLVTGYFGEAVHTTGKVLRLGGLFLVLLTLLSFMKSGKVELLNWLNLLVVPFFLPTKHFLKFVFIGWAIYPIGYMAGTEGWYSGIFGGLPMDVIYNVGDAINKIGFGLVVYNLAVNSK